MAKKQNLFIRIIRPILNLSIFWKIGLIIGICVSINTLVAFYFYVQLYKLRDYFKTTPFYAYKTLAIEGLSLTEELNNIDPLNEKSKDIKLAIRQLAHIGLKGGVYEKEGKDIIWISSPAEEKIIQKVLNEIAHSNFAFPEEIYQNWKTILSWSLKQEKEFQNFLKEISEKGLHFFIFISIVLFLCLLWGAFTFFFMIKRPLDHVTSQIHSLIAEGETYCIMEPEECEWRSPSKDEIGNLSRAVRDLLRHYTELALFRHTIEEDQSVEDVYSRLAQAFKEKLKLETFALYQVSNSQNTMSIMHISPSELEVNKEKLINADICRAKRTGHTVTSILQPGVCPAFPWKDEAEHYCIPFMSGGQCIGVAEILLPKTPETRRSKKIKKKLKLAERYIREAVPVIEAKRYAESLKDLSFKDPLTGLYNRRFLEESIDNIVAGILRRNSVLGILMADLDYFKSVNDRYGHDIGDRVLRETARLIKKNVRASDLVVRFGGEEFLILLVDVREGESVKVAEKLRSLIETHRIETPKGIIRRTISIGVSEFPIDTNAIWEAIKFADVALYKAKENGRNQVVRFSPEMWPENDY